MRIDQSADSMLINRASMSVDENDNLYVVWQEQTIRDASGNVDNAFYATSNDGGLTWSTPVQMSNCTVNDGSDHSVEWPSIGLKIRPQYGDIFRGGADAVWIQYNPNSALGWDLMYYRIPLVKQSGLCNATEHIPTAFELSQNYPNPFNPHTRIHFQLTQNGWVELAIYNGQGQKIKTLVNQNLAAQSYEISWDGTDSARQPVASGVYFYRLSTSGVQVQKKMVLLR